MLDEPKETQDTTTSEGTEDTPQETQTFTEEQVEKMVSKARSDALSEVGRIKKSADDSYKIAQDALKRLQAREEADLQRELEQVRDDPEKLSAVRIKQEAIKQRAEAEAKMREVEREKAEIQTQRSEVLGIYAERLAEKYNVSSDTIVKFGGGSKDNMQELAKSFGERVAMKVAQPDGAGTQSRMTSPPDSGRTKGAVTGKRPSLEEVQSASPQEYMAKINSGEWIQ